MREGWTCLDLEIFELHTSKSMAEGTSGDERVVGLVVEAGIQMPKQYPHHLHNRSAEQNSRSSDKWKLSSLEHLGVRLVASFRLLHLERHSRPDRHPAPLRQLHKQRLGPAKQLQATFQTVSAN